MIDVLVVDDDANLRKLITFALGLDPELVVRACESGDAALASVAEKAPALVLLDLELPGMGGVEIASRIGALAPSAVIVFVTGTERFGGEGRAVIRKPFDPVTLAAEVRAHLACSRG